ncbi:MAG: phytanoyl-CoA dioxygenase family protein [Candidatus Poribacteria bacterium]|nr:phytanoyl-CoA dioxygenase family protein [Candidatus Poribacteria bacterium]
MILTMNKIEMEMGGKYLGWLREANGVLGDREELYARFKADGYLLIRGLYDPENVKATRRFLLRKLDENEQLDRAHPVSDGIPAEGKRGMFMGGNSAVTHQPEFLNLVESPEVLGFFVDFFGAPVITYDYKWLRVVQPSGFTGAHYDIVYMGRGTQHVVTCWTPIGDLPLEMGPLAILVGSHRFDLIKQTYGEMDVDRDNVTGSFSNDPIELVDRYGGQWGTSSFKMGDVLIFGMFTMHGSLDNTTNRYRLSADTRFQRADEPVDERWIGDEPIAHYAWMQGETVPMEKMRKRWGV